MTSWGKPSDEAFILASEAWYVVGHTLASFAEQADAEAFREAHGGELGDDIERMDDQGAMETAH